ncbi:hypothetical protein OF83DRAFT_513157 [Amylostereum chailletii]|nr:hypothetical protein OF83DRAFT_513157 [Amylostereum chailletii]
MTRPRDSLLSMFDPLATGAEVRDVSSPEPSSSDKENSQRARRSSLGDSPITLTKFFNRTYTRHKTLPAPLPKGNLIDFDISMDEDTDADTDGMASADEDMENENSENVRPSSSSTAPITPRRRVLADIALDDEHTPVALKNPPPAFVLSKTPMSSVRPTAAPACSPLASVINSINGIPSSPPPSPPLISILPPPPGSPSPKRRQTSTSLCARPVSVDLQSSFSMHLRETSFDLLNDKISFLGIEGSMEDIDMEMKPDSVPAMTPRLGPARSGKRRSFGYESDKGGLADVESDCDVDMEDSLVERLRDVRFGEDNDMEYEATPEPELEMPPPMTPACGRSRAPSDPGIRFRLIRINHSN